MNTGKIKFFNSEKGFGFITNGNGKDIFFHVTGLKDNNHKTRLQPDVPVTFEIIDGKRGIQASNIDFA